MSNLIEKYKKEGRIYQEVDGYYYFDLSKGQGVLAAHNLREIADELDRLNGARSNADIIKQFPPVSAGAENQEPQPNSMT